MVAADEPNARKHMELESVPNLQVVARQSYGIYMYSRSRYTSYHSEVTDLISYV
jgi:hypothetical protein